MLIARAHEPVACHVDVDRLAVDGARVASVCADAGGVVLAARSERKGKSRSLNSVAIVASVARARVDRIGSSGAARVGGVGVARLARCARVDGVIGPALHGVAVSVVRVEAAKTALQYSTHTNTHADHFPNGRPCASTHRQ